MPADRYLADCIEKNLIKPENIVFRQIDKVIAAAAKDIMVAEKLLAIDEGHAYETAYTAMLHAARALPLLISRSTILTKNIKH